MSTSEPAQPEPTSAFKCPQCHAPVRADDLACPACGANLALAAVLAERRVMAAMPAAPAEPYEADLILPRFGEFLVRDGYITDEQLAAALDRQSQAVVQGQIRTIGQILLEMGVVTREQLDRAGILQVQQLQHALQEQNRLLQQRVIERTQELQQALQKLTELSALKANFVANISHELRTPLVPVKGYTVMLTNGALGPLNEQQLYAIDVITRSAARLEGLVNELILFASSVKGEMAISPGLFALHDLAARLMVTFEPKATAGEVDLDTDISPDLPLVSADGEKIYWALFQLLDNAIKFTPPGGQVRLTAEVHPPRLRLSVRDTGPGIAPERLGEIFQPFSRMEGTPDQLYEGTGLGLALVKRIVEAHASRIQVESQLGQGSTFSFDLPVVIPRDEFADA